MASKTASTTVSELDRAFRRAAATCEFCAGAGGRREVLVADEATASVDTYTRTPFSGTRAGAHEGRTSIVIAHRLSTVREMDRIHVIACGKIRETGTHAELMSMNGLYAKLSRMHIDEE